MTRQKIIEKAIQGGWKPLGHTPYKNKQNTWVILHDTSSGSCGEIPIDGLDHFFLDCTFWQALGKKEGWDWEEYDDQNGNWSLGEWHDKMHALIDHLALGGSIETFLIKI
jgi:hypothetical protein